MKKNSSKRWTQKEKEMLLKMLDERVPRSKISKKLGKTTLAIKRIITKLKYKSICLDCGERIENKGANSSRCDECAKIYNKKNKKEYDRGTKMVNYRKKKYKLKKQHTKLSRKEYLKKYYIEKIQPKAKQHTQLMRIERLKKRCVQQQETKQVEQKKQQRLTAKQLEQRQLAIIRERWKKKKHQRNLAKTIIEDVENEGEDYFERILERD